MDMMKQSAKKFVFSVLFTFIFLFIFHGLADRWSLIFGLFTTIFLLPVWLNSDTLFLKYKIVFALLLFFAHTLLIYVFCQAELFTRYYQFYVVLFIAVVLTLSVKRVYLKRDWSHSESKK